MDFLGRYYTQELYSNLLVEQIAFSNPNKVLDLGVGGGSLIKAASQRWKDADFYAADIDNKSVKIINQELPFVKIINANSLKNNINKKLELTIGSVDVAVCNPPYLTIKDKTQYKSLLLEAQLDECVDLIKLTSDIVFLAQNLRLLQNQGELGIILPDGLITGHEFYKLRRSIMSSHNLKAVIELPPNIFSKTEAKTHIVLLEKGSNTPAIVPLYSTNKRGQCDDQIDISSDSLLHRMDYSYHKWQKKLKVKKKVIKLSDLNCEIRRGKYTHTELKFKGEKFLHTTNFVHCSRQNIKNTNKFSAEENYSHKSTIILARVGRGCMGKISRIDTGSILLSDCLYSIKVPSQYFEAVWESMISESGQKWFKANSHGVCAKVLSKTDLFDFPVEIKL